MKFPGFILLTQCCVAPRASKRIPKSAFPSPRSQGGGGGEAARRAEEVEESVMQVVIISGSSAVTTSQPHDRVQGRISSVSAWIYFSFPGVIRGLQVPTLPGCVE